MSHVGGVLQVASWSRGEVGEVTETKLKAGCDRVIALLQPLLPARQASSIDASEELEQEVGRLQLELQELGLSPEEYPIDLKPLADFFMCAHPPLTTTVAFPELAACEQRLRACIGQGQGARTCIASLNK